MGRDLKGKELGANLSQRKDGRYEAKYTDNFGKRHSIYGIKLADVKKQLNEALYNRDHNIYNKDVRFTLDEWFRIWLETIKKGSIKNTTYDRYLRCYKNNISPYIGKMNIDSIKQVHIQNMFNNYNKEKKLSYSTLTHLRSLLKDIFNYALANEYIVRNPVTKIIIKNDKTNKSVRVLSLEEQRIFLEYAQNYSYYNLYVFLIYTGCRIGEALALTWDDIDLKSKIISINKTFGKNYNYETKSVENYTHSPKTTIGNRQIPIHPIVEDMLVRLKKEDFENTKCKIVFHTRNMTNIYPDDVWKNIQVIINRINLESPNIQIKRFSAHTLRHTFATNCFSNDINAKVVQSYLGHTSLKMTMDLYTHVTQEIKMDEIKKLDSLV